MQKENRKEIKRCIYCQNRRRKSDLKDVTRLYADDVLIFKKIEMAVFQNRDDEAVHGRVRGS